MAAWPTLAELKAALGVTGDTNDTVLQRSLDAGVEQVALDCDLADPVPVDVSASLSQAALILAVGAAKAPDAPFGIAAVFDIGALYVAQKNPNYQRLIHGHRSTFGIA